MASPSISFVRSLVRYGQKSAGNLAKLETWQDEAIEAIAENKGGHTISGSANGVTFTQSAGMTNFEWAALLGTVLQHIENGTMPTSRTIARLA